MQRKQITIKLGFTLSIRDYKDRRDIIENTVLKALMDNKVIGVGDICTIDINYSASPMEPYHISINYSTDNLNILNYNITYDWGVYGEDSSDLSTNKGEVLTQLKEEITSMEKEILQKLGEVWNDYVLYRSKDSLPGDGKPKVDDNLNDFRKAIHDAQRIITYHYTKNNLPKFFD